MNGGGSSGLQQASGAANSSTSSAGKQPPQLQVLILKAKGKEIREKEEKAAVVRGLFSPPATMSHNRTMPVTRAEYEAVPEWKLQCLCSENGGLPSPIKSQLGGGFCF